MDTLTADQITAPDVMRWLYSVLDTELYMQENSKHIPTRQQPDQDDDEFITAAPLISHTDLPDQRDTVLDIVLANGDRYRVTVQEIAR